MKHAAIAFAVAAALAGPVIAQDTGYAPQPGAAPAQAPAAAPSSAPGPAVTPAPDRDAAGVYQVFRTTDNQLNCAQLISEMNNLNAVIKGQADAAAAAQAKAAPKAPGAARGLAGNVLGGALGGIARNSIARNVPGLGAVGATVAASATDAASGAVGNAVAGRGGQPQAAAPAGPTSASNEQQRLNRVSGLFGAKGC